MALMKRKQSSYALLGGMLLALIVLSGCGERDDAPSQNLPEFDPSLPPLAIEETGNVVTLPQSFPNSWMFIDDSSFSSMYGGKVFLIDVAEPNPPSRIKGLIEKNLIGNFIQSPKRGELYVAETFHERGARGKRTDVLTIYKTTELAPIKEIILPSKRLTALPERYSMGLSADENFLYVANFNPAASFSVIDLRSHTLIEVIETPGCVLTYPTGKRTVTSICSNGGLLSTTVSDEGRMLSQKRIPPFFDTDKTPVFERPAIINGMAYFPSFESMMHVVDLTGEDAKYISQWDMLSDAERKEGWRPGGLGLVDHDENGNMYVIMHKDGFDGSHNGGGSQVWVFDVKAKKRIKVIETPNWSISIGVSRGDKPLLVVTNGELGLDVFDAHSAKYIHTISDFGNVTPLFIHKAH